MAFQARQAAGTTTEAFPDFSGLWSDRQRKDGDDSATCQITIGCTTGRDRFHRRCVIRSHPAPPPSTCPPLQFHPHKDPSILGVPPTRTPPSSVFHAQGPLHPRCSAHKDPAILGVPPSQGPLHPRCSALTRTPSSAFRPHKDPSGTSLSNKWEVVLCTTGHRPATAVRESSAVEVKGPLPNLPKVAILVDLPGLEEAERYFGEPTDLSASYGPVLDAPVPVGGCT